MARTDRSAPPSGVPAKRFKTPDRASDLLTDRRSLLALVGVTACARLDDLAETPRHPLAASDASP